MTLQQSGSFLHVVALTLCLTACTTAGEPPASTAPSAVQATLVEARAKLVADVQACTDQHGYDPDNVSGIGEKELAPGELQWRQCCYDAARRYIGQNPAMRGMYEQLIAEDIQLTSAIQQGTVTRTQRRARDEELLAQIRNAEEAQIKGVAAESEKQMEQVQRVVNGLRGLGS